VAQSKGPDEIYKIIYKFSNLFSFSKEIDHFYEFKQLYNMTKIHEI